MYQGNIPIFVNQINYKMLISIPERNTQAKACQLTADLMYTCHNKEVNDHLAHTRVTC